MLFESSEENPERARARLLPGRVRRFADAPGPQGPAHGLEPDRARPGGRGAAQPGGDVPDGTYFYFVHSYYPDPARADDVALSSEHGVRSAPRSRATTCSPASSTPKRARRPGSRCCAALRRACRLGARPMLVFPAIDLLGGKAVRLERGGARAPRCTTDAPWELAARLRRGGRARGCTSSISTPRSPRGRRASTTTRPSRRIVAAAAVDVEVGRRRAHRWTTARGCSTWACGYVVLGTAAVKDPALVEAAVRALAAADRRRGRRARGQGRGRGLDRGHGRRRGRGRRRRWRAPARARCSTPTSRATACAAGPTWRPPRGWRGGIAPCPVIASGGVARLDDLDALLPTGATSRSSSARRSTRGCSPSRRRWRARGAARLGRRCCASGSSPAWTSTTAA